MRVSLLQARRVPDKQQGAHRAPPPRYNRTSLVPTPRSAPWQLGGTAQLLRLPPASLHLTRFHLRGEATKGTRAATQSPLPLPQPQTEACVVSHGKAVSDGPHPGENGPLKHEHDVTGTGVLSTGNELLENLSGAMGTGAGNRTGREGRQRWSPLTGWWKRRAGTQERP